MKKILLTLVLLILFIPGVKAETTEDNNVYQANKEVIENIYDDLMTEYQNIEYPYYNVNFSYANLDENYEVQNNSQSYITGYLYYFYENNNYSSDKGRIYISYRCNSDCIYTTNRELKGSGSYGSFNSSILELQNTFKNYAGNMLLQNGESPNYYINTIEGQYIEVNLDNYEYVILSLKDYFKNDAFDTNLQVKGMIGITPVYEFGTIEKENITDRCNISYSAYTDYRLYILKNDLINNAVYFVKACEDGSSFKFDTSIFDITYVTADNVDDPVITVGGQEYNTIPFNKLSNSANQNEENNFIPGTNEQFNPIGGVTEYISNFWNGLVTFMGLVTKFFNTLPIEIRAISITAFSTGLTLGIIKFIKS